VPDLEEETIDPDFRPEEIDPEDDIEDDPDE
jgi:hypothetical protein